MSEQAAAAARGQTLSEFVRQAARREAEQVMAESTAISLDEAEAKRFLAALEDPAPFEPGLRSLLDRPSVLGEVEGLRPVGPLDRGRHRVDRFHCGRQQLDRWLRAYAAQGQRRDTARTFVTCRAGVPEVAGYYTLLASQVEHDDATGSVRLGTSAHFPIPVCLLARLAVEQSAQGVGLGRSLLLDALRRVDRASREVAIRAVLVHAIDNEAGGFYARFGFEPASAHPLTLMVPLEAVRRTLGQ